MEHETTAAVTAGSRCEQRATADVTSVCVKSSRHGKSTAEKWNR